MSLIVYIYLVKKPVDLKKQVYCLEVCKYSAMISVCFKYMFVLNNFNDYNLNRCKDKGPALFEHNNKLYHSVPTIVTASCKFAVCVVDDHIHHIYGKI